MGQDRLGGACVGPLGEDLDLPLHTPSISHSLPVGKVSFMARFQRAPGPGLTDSDSIIQFPQLPRQCLGWGGGQSPAHPAEDPCWPTNSNGGNARHGSREEGRGVSSSAFEAPVESP